MDAMTIYRHLSDAGVQIGSRSGKLLAAPPERLNDDLRELIRANRDELLAFLASSSKTTTQLLAAAMRVCDQYGDSDTQRDEMRRDCLALPLPMQADLLDYFRGRR